MQDTSALEYSLAATVCLEPKRVLQLRQIVSVEDFSIPPALWSLTLPIAQYHAARRLM